MRYKKFGNTGLFVSELCLGTMTFGGQGELWSKIGQLPQEEANRLVGRALEAGVNFIDTADVYSEGRSETITGQALRDLKVARDEVVIATKVFGQTGAGPNARGNSRYHIMEGVKRSLARLGTDHIDLYQIHGFDPATPIEETVRALDDLVRQGHVRYVGVSNWSAWQIMKALGIAERRGLARFESLQAYYTVAGRDLERELVPMLQSENVGLMVWSPLAGGLLSGKYGRDGGGDAGSRRLEFDFRQSTVTAPTTASTCCAAWPRRAACRRPRWRWPGCWRSRWSARSSSAPSGSTSWTTTWPPSGWR